MKLRRCFRLGRFLSLTTEITPWPWAVAHIYIPVTQL